MRNNDRRLRSRHTTASQENRAAWLFLLPSLIGVLLFVLLPFVETIRRSMFDTMGSTWVGFSNYDSVLQNDAFQLAVANTARFLGTFRLLVAHVVICAARLAHTEPVGQYGSVEFTRFGSRRALAGMVCSMAHSKGCASQSQRAASHSRHTWQHCICHHRLLGVGTSDHPCTSKCRCGPIARPVCPT